MKKLGYKSTTVSCYIGYISQAIVNNFSPLLFVMFSTQFDISLTQLSLMIAINFGVQLLTDFVAARLVDRVGYRPFVVAAHFLCAAGLSLMSVLPYIMPPYIGLLISTVFSAVGGGLIEVIVSPIIEACPSDNKASAMSLLHSFYCWGFFNSCLPLCRYGRVACYGVCLGAHSVCQRIPLYVCADKCAPVRRRSFGSALSL